MNRWLRQIERHTGRSQSAPRSRFFPQDFRRAVALGAAGLLLSLTAAGQAHAEAPANRRAALSHGINMTRWFSAPYAQSPAHYASYVTPAVLSQLKSAGFSYIRIALAPEALQTADGGLNQTV